MPPKRKINLEKLEYLYTQTEKTIAQIKEELGCSMTLIKHYAYKHKWTKYSKFNFITKELLEDLYVKQEMSMSQIAKKLGVKKSNIQLKVEKYNLKQDSDLHTYNITKEELQDFINQKYTLKQIADYFKCSTSVVWSRLNKYDIKSNKKSTNSFDEKLRDLYLNKQLSCKEIGEVLNITIEKVRYHLKRLGLRVRERNNRLKLDDSAIKAYVEQRLTYEQIAEKMGLSVSQVANRARRLKITKPEHELHSLDYETLYQLYIVQKLSQAEIGEMYNCSRSMVSRRLKELNISEKDREAKEISCEQLNNLYINQDLSLRAISLKLKISDKQLKKKIKEYKIVKEYKWSNLTKEILTDLYVNKGMNTPEIAKMLNCSQAIISSKIYDWSLNDQRTSEEHIKSINRSYHNARSMSRSKYETEIGLMYPTEHTNACSILPCSQELDLYYPEHNFAIEYNGEYWHSSAVNKAHTHLAKLTQCYNRGIFVMNIFERFWTSKTEKPKIINIIDNILQPQKLKHVSGEVRLVTPIEEKEFLIKNCIDGIWASDFCLGTYNGNELLNVLSFKKVEDCKYKIVRFSTKVGYKEDYLELFNYFKKEHCPKEVEVKCDRMYYDGSLFTSMGFDLVKFDKAEYSYIKGRKIISRKTYSKNPEKYSDYYKIFDCGKVVLQFISQ